MFQKSEKNCDELDYKNEHHMMELMLPEHRPSDELEFEQGQFLWDIGAPGDTNPKEFHGT